MIESVCLAPAIGATICHNSSVMNGMIGCARAAVVSNAHQGAAGGALCRLAATLQLHLGQFDVPVAVFVPGEFVNGLCRQVETVGLQCPVDRGFGLRCRR